MINIKKRYKTIKNVDEKIYFLISKLKRQFLHAKTLGFIHPKTKKKMLFNSILPKELNNIIKMLNNTGK